MADKRRDTAPVVRVYGESDHPDNPDFLHIEALIDRSSLHEFKIKPHRHNGLHQLFFLHAGQGIARLDGETLHLQAPCLLVVRSMCVHDFDWDAAVAGYAMTLAQPLCNSLQQRLGTPMLALETSGVLPLADAGAALSGLFAQLLSEYRQNGLARIVMLESLLSVLLVSLARETGRDGSSQGEQGRRGRYLQRFNQLIEQHHHQQQPVSFYAHQLHITPTHLNALCRALTGQAALELIHERLLVAAKRSLIYSDASISEIAWALSFSEPAYFSRFFKRLTGVSPKAFRAGNGRLEYVGGA